MKGRAHTVSMTAVDDIVGVTFMSNLINDRNIDSQSKSSWSHHHVQYILCDVQLIKYLKQY